MVRSGFSGAQRLAQLPLQLADFGPQVEKIALGDNQASKLPLFDQRMAHVLAGFLDGLQQARIPADPHVIADLQMSGNHDVSAQHHPVAHPGAAGE